jgi:hypothetical protein
MVSVFEWNDPPRSHQGPLGMRITLRVGVEASADLFFKALKIG